MSSNDKWMPLYVADYLGDTMHLTTLQHGAYVLLLMHYWRTGPLPNDPEELAAIVKLDAQAWRGVWAKLSGFFTVNGDGTLHQKRMDWERRRWEEISDKRRDAGKRGAEAKYRSRPTNGGGPITPQAKQQPPQSEVASDDDEVLAIATILPEHLPVDNLAIATDLPYDLPPGLPPALPDGSGNCQDFAMRFASVPLPPQKGSLSSYLGKEAAGAGAREGNPSKPQEDLPASAPLSPPETRDALKELLASLPPPPVPDRPPERNHTLDVQKDTVTKPQAPKACPLVGDHLMVMRRRAGIRVVA